MGKLKQYDVGGLDVLGTGKPAPADTVLRLHDDEAERLGLKGRRVDAEEPAAKPRKASTRKRSAPKPAEAAPAKAPRSRKRST